MTKYRFIYWALMPVVAFAVLYFYFLPFQTHILYGDDLNFYKLHFKLHTFSDWFNCTVFDLKFRPVAGLINGVLIYYFDKDLHYYYLFNVLIQTGIVLLFTLVADLLFSSLLLAFMAGMLVGTSRFAYYNITQICWGGPMEGTALLLFLATVYCLLRTFTQPANSNKQNHRWLLLATLLANLTIYTHERYIVLFPFIILIAWLFPYKNKLTIGQKSIVSIVGISSIAANIIVKKFVYALPFLVGTGGQQIHPSPMSALTYLSQGVLSILQINAGGESMIGVSIKGIEHAFQFIVALLGVYMFILLRQFLHATKEKFSNDQDAYSPRIVMVFLSAILLLCLLPAIATVRLEQRWLQASFCIFILLLIVAVSSIRSFSPATRLGSFALFMLLFILSDHNYLYKGARKTSIAHSEKVARALLNAVQRGIIKQDAGHLYFEEDWWLFTEWVTGQGYLFACYDRPLPAIKFVNDLHLGDSGYIAPLPDFNAGKDQVIRIKEDTVMDITSRYLP